jgi:uncharacterized DUF497 family protein
MTISWDHRKSIANRKKHGVSFELAQEVFSDPLHLSVKDRVEHGEERWQTLGQVCGVVLLLVAHTYGEDSIRIISARKATKHERRQYEQSR